MEKNRIQITDKSGKTVSFLPTRSSTLTDATEHIDPTGFLLHIHTAGTVDVLLVDDDINGTARTFNVADGGYIPSIVKKVFSTSTAVGLVKLQ